MHYVFEYDDEKVVWKGNLTQEDALGFCLDYCDENERDIMESVQSKIEDNLKENCILPMNPCHFGMVFGGFQIGKTNLS